MNNKSGVFETDFKRLEEQVLKELAINPTLLSFDSRETATKIMSSKHGLSKIVRLFQAYSGSYTQFKKLR